MKAVLVLKCEGFQKDGFQMCSGVENVILDLERLEATPNYIALIKYLDAVAGLFAAPAVNMNVVSNALYKIFELGYVSEKTYNNLSYFCNLHKLCAPILALELK